MSAKRRRHSAEYKFKVALEAAKGDRTLSQLAEQYQLHPGPIRASTTPFLVKFIKVWYPWSVKLKLSLILPLSWSNTWGSPAMGTA